MTKGKFLKYLRFIFNYDNFLPYPLENVELTAYIVADGIEIVYTAELRDFKFKIYFWLLYQYAWNLDKFFNYDLSQFLYC